MGAVELTAFSSHFAVERRLSASTQNQALNAIASFYPRVLAVEHPVLEGLARVQAPWRVGASGVRNDNALPRLPTRKGVVVAGSRGVARSD
jgi:hypothetical protein